MADAYDTVSLYQYHCNYLVVKGSVHRYASLTDDFEWWIEVRQLGLYFQDLGTQESPHTKLRSYLLILQDPKNDVSK